MEEEIVQYPLVVKKKKWDAFKELIPRHMTIKDKLNELIDAHIETTKKVI